MVTWARAGQLLTATIALSFLVVTLTRYLLLGLWFPPIEGIEVKAIQLDAWTHLGGVLVGTLALAWGVDREGRRV